MENYLIIAEELLKLQKQIIEKFDSFDREMKSLIENNGREDK